MSIQSPHFGTAYRLIFSDGSDRPNPIHDEYFDLARLKGARLKIDDTLSKHNISSNHSHAPVRFLEDPTIETPHKEALVILTNEHSDAFGRLYNVSDELRATTALQFFKTIPASHQLPINNEQDLTAFLDTHLLKDLNIKA
jgi:hypothetical protein